MRPRSRTSAKSPAEVSSGPPHSCTHGDPLGGRGAQGVLDVLAALVGAAGGVEGGAGGVLGVTGDEPVAQPAVEPVGPGDHGQRAGHHRRVAVDPRRVDDPAEAGPVELGRGHRAVLGPVVLLPVQDEQRAATAAAHRPPRRPAAPGRRRWCRLRSTPRSPIPVCERCAWASTKAGSTRAPSRSTTASTTSAWPWRPARHRPSRAGRRRPRRPSRRAGPGCGPARGGRASSPWRHSRSEPVGGRRRARRGGPRLRWIMAIPHAVGKLNKVATNKVLVHLAGHGPFIELEHVGRRSGRVYRVPLNAFRTGDAVTFALTYGPPGRLAAQRAGGRRMPGAVGPRDPHPGRAGGPADRGRPGTDAGSRASRAAARPGRPLRRDAGAVRGPRGLTGPLPHWSSRCRASAALGAPAARSASR